MRIICKLLKMDPDSRDGIISGTSLLGIAVNLLIATVKIVIGTIASSVAIVSEGLNNASDVMTSVLALLGSKLAQKRPDARHPFGYGRIEYMASLTISVLIVVTGTQMLTESVRQIRDPAPIGVSWVSLVIVAVSAAAKFVLGVYTMHMGEKAGSNALIGVGVDSRNDSFASLITIVSTTVFLIFGMSVDAWAGMLISLLILKAGIELLRDTMGDLLGRAGDKELAAKLYKEIRSTPGVLSAADMMLHNYGPDAWSGSVNVEIDHMQNVGDVYQVLHELQLRIMHEYSVTMVFGIYAVDNDHEESRELRKRIAEFLREKKYVKSYHAVYIDETKNEIYCDFIADYQLRDWDALREEFINYMKEIYPDYKVNLTIETEYV